MNGRRPLQERISFFAVRLSEDRYFSIKLFAAAFAVRALFTFTHPAIYLVADMIGYNEAAMSLLQDGQFRVKGVVSASRPPVYPYFLMVIYYIFGHHFLIARLMQAVAGALITTLVFSIGKDMFDRKIGALAGIIYAFYPASWAMGDMLLTETLFTFLMLLSVKFMMRIPQMRSPWVIFWAGLFAGGATLTRTAFMPFTVFVLLGVAVFKFSSPKIISRYALMAVIFFLVIFPWMLRNNYTHGLITLNPKSGTDFYMYNHSGLRFIINNYVNMEDFYEKKAWTWTEVEKGRYGSEKAVEWIKGNPHLFLIKGVRMIMNIWGLDRDYHWWYIAGYYGKDPKWLVGLMALLMGLPFIVIAPLSLAGFFISEPFKDNKLIPTLVIICLHILTFVVYGFSRHRFPYAALLVIWAAYALINWDRVRETLRKGNRTWRKKAIVFSWGFLVFSWVVEILVDVVSVIGMRFVYPGF